MAGWYATSSAVTTSPLTAAMVSVQVSCSLLSSVVGAAEPLPPAGVTVPCSVNALVTVRVPPTARAWVGTV